MRSSEVAKAADVSVRTLRHYHDLGLLPEPPRSANGYRDYSALDVARVLRIKRLASLGLSLADIAELENGQVDRSQQSKEMSSSGDGTVPVPDASQGTLLSANKEDALLAELDAELERKIASLQAQRRTIAALRAEHLDPTLPEAFARAVKLFYGEEGLASAELLSDKDRAALILAGHFYTEDETKELERFAAETARRGVLEQLRAVDQKVAALSPDASTEEQDALVEETLAFLDPLIECFDPINWLEEEDEREEADWRLFDTMMDSIHNPAQRAVNDRVEAAIIERMRVQRADHPAS